MKNKYLPIKELCESAYDFLLELVNKPFETGRYELYAPNCEGIDYLLNDGDFLIITPEQAHAPGINVGGPSEVHKAVFKIPVK